MSDVIVVVPCYNEAARLDGFRFQEYAASAPRVRFLFVDDGSTDDTAALVDGIRLKAPESFGLLRLEENRGKAEAVRQGLLAALQKQPNYVGYWDADLATPLSALADFVRILDERPEIHLVLGSRVRLLGRQIERRTVRHYLGRVFATAASLVLRLPVYDTQCGAKLFRVSDSLRGPFREPFRSRWIFDVEILARLSLQEESARLDRIVYELPLIEWRDVGASKIKTGDFARAALDLGVIYWGLSRARRPVRKALPTNRADPKPAGLPGVPEHPLAEHLPGRVEMR